MLEAVKGKLRRMEEERELGITHTLPECVRMEWSSSGWRTARFPLENDMIIITIGSKVVMAYWVRKDISTLLSSFLNTDISSFFISSSARLVLEEHNEKKEEAGENKQFANERDKRKCIVATKIKVKNNRNNFYLFFFNFMEPSSVPACQAPSKEDVSFPLTWTSSSSRQKKVKRLQSKTNIQTINNSIVAHAVISFYFISFTIAEREKEEEEEEEEEKSYIPTQSSTQDRSAYMLPSVIGVKVLLGQRTGDISDVDSAPINLDAFGLANEVK
eukprot:gene6336-4563_t